MMKSVIYLLVLIVVSAQGRVAIKDDNISEITNNIVDLEKNKPKEIHIDLPTTTEINNDISETKDPTNTKLLPTIKINGTLSADFFKTFQMCPENVNEIGVNLICIRKKVDVGSPLMLTPYIKEGRISEAREASIVNPELFLGVKSYSGFMTVNETTDANMFFWFFPIENKPLNSTPWIIWLQGGPGATSMTGLFDEVGPFTVDKTGKLVKNPFGWSRNHSLLFIDNPVGTGYSYTTHADGFAKDMTTYGNHLYTTVKQLVQIFPELRVAPLYIAGESYAGKYVPALGIEIHRNKNNPGGDINLQGLIVGNGYIDPGMISQMTRPFYYFGLLETEQIKLLQPLLDAFQKDINANRSVAAKGKWNTLIQLLLLLTHQKHVYNFLRDELSVGKYLPFLKRDEIKKAIHVGDVQCSFVNMTVNSRLNGDFLSTAKPLFEELLDHYKVLTYCGQLDQMLSCVVTSENYRTWKWSGSNEFLQAPRYPFVYGDKLAGYHKKGGHFTEAIIRGAGHMVPLDTPGPIQALVARWVADQSQSPYVSSYEKYNIIETFIRNITTTADAIYL